MPPMKSISSPCIAETLAAHISYRSNYSLGEAWCISGWGPRETISARR
jgi:hypothetical protein